MGHDAFARHGLDSAALVLISALHQRPDQTVSELVGTSSVSRATTYRTLQRLADHGLVLHTGETWTLAPRALEGFGNRLPDAATSPDTAPAQGWDKVAEQHGIRAVAAGSAQGRTEAVPAVAQTSAQQTAEAPSGPVPEPTASQPTHPAVGAPEAGTESAGMPVEQHMPTGVPAAEPAAPAIQPTQPAEHASINGPSHVTSAAAGAAPAAEVAIRPAVPPVAGGTAFPVRTEGPGAHQEQDNFAQMQGHVAAAAATAQGDDLIGEVVRAGWMRIWETVHLALGADADRTAGFFACGMPGTTLAAMRLPQNAGRRGSVPEGRSVSARQPRRAR
jgi:hypothetical protein